MNGEIYREYDDGGKEVSYSIVSAADETHLGKGAVRLIVESEDDHIVINDAAVTSHSERFQLLRGEGHHHVYLTISEAVWLLRRLQIAAERRRQIEREGWMEDHDDEHEYEELAMAAACYAWGEDAAAFGPHWPETWSEDSDRRKDHPRRRQLIIAGALLVAEIERLDRAAAMQERLARRMAARP